MTTTETGLKKRVEKLEEDSRVSVKRVRLLIKFENSEESNGYEQLEKTVNNEALFTEILNAVAPIQGALNYTNVTSELVSKIREEMERRGLPVQRVS